ncbi:unnamed protein product [Phytophthora lilii]|uniref:Unnamed protein product n=1 Tax=Phytophthora lilii TaxID=2077276 RepID=A0A9W6X655_9STRA|nr:unnamed protein product [Phytophthora lilii]
MEEQQQVDSVPDTEPNAVAGATSMMPQVQVDDVQVDVGSVNLMNNGTPLKILIASWNVGNTMPPKDSKLLNDWIPEGGGDFDVIAVGLQESTYKNEKVSENLVRTDSWHNSSSKADDQEDEDHETDPPTLDSVFDATEVEEGEEDDEEEEDDSEAKTEEPGAKVVVKRSGHISSSNTDENNSPSSEAIRTGRAGGPFSSSSSEHGSTSANGTSKSSDVIVKRSRTKKSMRKMTRMVRQLSSNLRDTMGDVLDYPFSKQIYLHLGENYVLAGKVELMEMRLFVYVHERNNVGEVEKLAVPTGLGSVIGNKCATILGAQFGQKNVSIDHQFDHCFWFGDLNYRLDLNYTAPRQRNHEKHCAEVMALVRAKKWAALNQNDQLKHQVEAKKALTGWELPPALFPPTFKRVRHSLDEYLVKRVPSYCDRVLYKSLPGLRGNIKLQRFSCFEAIATSDHKPIAAAFQVGQTPAICAGAAEKPTLVEIVDLAGKDLLGLDLAGLSDPYIKFYSAPSNAIQIDANGSHPSTSTISNSCSPKYVFHVHKNKADSTNDRNSCLRDVKRVHLTLVIMDYDATSKDDLMGKLQHLRYSLGGETNKLLCEMVRCRVSVVGKVLPEPAALPAV